MKAETVEINTAFDATEASIAVCDFFKNHGPCEMTVFIKADKKRTLPQNAALHLYCTVMAKDMTDAGFTQRKLTGAFKEGFELPVTMHMVKEIFREVGRAMFDKDSTSKLSTGEVQKVYQVIDQRFGEITGVRAEWPTSENMYYDAMGVKR